MGVRIYCRTHIHTHDGCIFTEVQARSRIYVQIHQRMVWGVGRGLFDFQSPPHRAPPVVALHQLRVAALLGVLRLLKLALVLRGDRGLGDGEELVQAGLRLGGPRLLQLCNPVEHTLTLELLLLTEVLQKAFFVGVAEHHLALVTLVHLRLLEQLPSLGIRVVLRQRVFCGIQVLDELLNRFVLPDAVERLHRPDAGNASTVVAPQQNAHVDELILRHVQRLEHRLQVEFEDRLLLRLRVRQVAQQNLRPKRQGVHVLRAHGPRLAGPHNLRALRLCLRLRVNHGKPHQPQQLLALFRLLLRHAHRPLAHLLNGLCVALLLRPLQLRACRLGLRLTLFQLFALHLGWRAVEHVHRFHALAEHAQRAAPQAL
eukprot:Rhum_TRINITY_DN3856_c0_g1::Rhum_TRINITY_DN3856_c0_g1_i1::g.12220::m.12220